MDTVTRLPPGSVRVRLVPLRASASLIARVVESRGRKRSAPLGVFGVLTKVDRSGLEALTNVGRSGFEARPNVAELLLWRACWKVEAKAEMEGKRSSGFFASARKITASIAAGRRGLMLLGAGGWVLMWAYIICMGFPWKGERSVRSS